MIVPIPEKGDHFGFPFFVSKNTVLGDEVLLSDSCLPELNEVWANAIIKLDDKLTDIKFTTSVRTDYFNARTNNNPFKSS